MSVSSRLPHQVIVSDDGDDWNTVEHIAKGFPFTTYQRGPRIGLGANRNACLNIVTGQYVAFIDDDVVLSPSFVDQASLLFEQADCTQRAPIFTGIERKHSSSGVIRIEPRNPNFWGYQRVIPDGFWKSLVINSTVFPRSLFDLARFDELLRYGSEELDMARHATCLGYVINFSPALHVDHFPSDVNRDEYAAFIDASRMYAAAKDYYSYQRSALKFVIFSLLAPPKLALSLGIRTGLKGIKRAVNSTFLAARYFRSMITKSRTTILP